MAVTLADKVTLARLALTPVIIASYLLLPIEHHWCFWVAGWLCGLAEFTDFIDTSASETGYFNELPG